MPPDSIHSFQSYTIDRCPKPEVCFFSQIIVLYIVIIACIINLSLGNGNAQLWTALLGSSLGYLLPNPSSKRKTLVFEQPTSE